CSCYERQLHGGFFFRRRPGIFKMYTATKEKFEEDCGRKRSAGRDRDYQNEATDTGRSYKEILRARTSRYQKVPERLMQAEFSVFCGQAFTDMYGDFEGTLQDVLAMELNNNYRRAIFVATLQRCNAASRDDREKRSLQGQRSC
ncbi:MAG: hypothetical protein U9N61_03860, partial [Euryarchaeota archaeon]|nr:hypothetical protein [Euryarchaeota archaeon]